MALRRKNRLLRQTATPQGISRHDCVRERACDGKGGHIENVRFRNHLSTGVTYTCFL